MPAWHTSTIAGSEEAPFSPTPGIVTGTPAGLVISIGGVTVYHAGDTCLFGDMKLIAERNPVDVAMLPIGGHYTMDRHDAAYAAELIGAGTVIPMHYDTFPPIATDAEAFKAEVESATSSKVELMKPGDTFIALSRLWLASQSCANLAAGPAGERGEDQMEAKEATGTQPRTEREDFQATADPALMEEADRTSEVKLLTYAELYLLWERQQWLTQDLDFSRDREDWHERIPAEERFQRMYGLSSFFIGEQKVAEELGPIMRAAPTEDQKLFLCTQIADEARHVRFFERFYREVGVLESDELSQMLEQTSEHLNDNFGRLFDEMLKQRTDRLSVEPEDTEALVEAVTLYHMVIEGMLALTGQHFIMDFNEREGTLPAFVEGFQNVARDEHRHVAFGSVFLREKAREDDRYKEAIQRALQESLPVADGVLSPPWAEDVEDWELFGYSLDETRQFAGTCLARRLKVIGLS